MSFGWELDVWIQGFEQRTFYSGLSSVKLKAPSLVPFFGDLQIALIMLRDLHMM